MYKKIALVALGFGLLVAPVFASADQLSDLQAQVQAILAQIAAQSPSSSSSCVDLTYNMGLRSTDATAGGDVTLLQNYLIAQNYLAAGNNTGYYGSVTAQAVGQLQTALDLVTSSSDPGYGLTGPKTRGAIACSGKGALSATPASGYVPFTANFLASINNWDGGAYSINFGDGTPLTALDKGGCALNNPCQLGASHAYTAPGTYTAKIENANGIIIGSATVVAYASASGGQPTAIINPQSLVISAGASGMITPILEGTDSNVTQLSVALKGVPSIPATMNGHSWLADVGSLTPGSYSVEIIDNDSGSNNGAILTIGTLTVYAASSTTQVTTHDITVGTGLEATNGSTVAITYTGALQDGTVFDSSAAHGNQPLTFVLGSNTLIPGLQTGVVGMNVGGERIITIPPSLGYGSAGVKNSSGQYIIPPNATLVYDVTLVSAQNISSSPTITSVSPNPVTQGSTITLTGTNLTNATGLLFCGNSGIGMSMNNQSTSADGTSFTATIASTAPVGQCYVQLSSGSNPDVLSPMFTVTAASTPPPPPISGTITNTSSTVISGTASNGVSWVNCTVTNTTTGAMYAGNSAFVGNDGTWNDYIAPALPAGNYTATAVSNTGVTLATQSFSVLGSAPSAYITAALIHSGTLGAFGTSNITANIGDSVRFRFVATSSAAIASEHFSFTPAFPDTCSTTAGANNFIPSTYVTGIAGTLHINPILACRAGDTYTVTYSVTDVNGHTGTSNQISVYVSPGGSAGGGSGASASDKLSQIASALAALQAIIQQLGSIGGGQ